MVGADGLAYPGDPGRAQDEHEADRRGLPGRTGLQLADQEQPDHDEADGDVAQVGHDPRIRLKPRSRRGRIVVPLTSQANGRHAWKVLIPPEPGEPEMRTHEGNEWLYVLSGKLRLILGDRDITINAGEVAEFDTRIPHWFGPADDQPAEILSLLSRHGKHMHVRAAATSKAKKD